MGGKQQTKVHPAEYNLVWELSLHHLLFFHWYKNYDFLDESCQRQVILRTWILVIDLHISDEAITQAWVSLNNSTKLPFPPDQVGVLDQYYIANFDVSMGCVPLLLDKKLGKEVLSPPLPERIDDQLYKSVPYITATGSVIRSIRYFIRRVPQEQVVW